MVARVFGLGAGLVVAWTAAYAVWNCRWCKQWREQHSVTHVEVSFGFLRKWFALGVLVSIVLLLLAIPLLLHDAAVSLLTPAETERFLVPVVAAVDARWQQAVLLLVIVVGGVAFHELGHALAAASEGVRTLRVSLFVALLLPGASVVLDADALSLLPPARALRVYCAGAWHNAFMAAGSWAGMQGLPWALKPLFHIDSGVMVLNVAKDAPFHGHMQLMDVLLSVDDCPINTVKDWTTCLQKRLQCVSPNPTPDSWRPPPPCGYCVPPSVAHARNESNICGGDFMQFWVADKEVCLRAKAVASELRCASLDSSNAVQCKPGLTCALPHLPAGMMLSQLSYVRENAATDNTVNSGVTESTITVLASPRELARSLSLTEYAPRVRFLRAHLLKLPLLLDVALTLSFHASLSLALLNILPVFFLDGQAVTTNLLLIAFPSMRNSRRRQLATLILLAGTVLLAIALGPPLLALFLNGV
eukprot:jgi/Chlat1/4710/Chrsp30S04749